MNKQHALLCISKQFHASSVFDASIQIKNAPVNSDYFSHRICIHEFFIEITKDLPHESPSQHGTIQNINKQTERKIILNIQSNILCNIPVINCINMAFFADLAHKM